MSKLKNIKALGEMLQGNHRLQTRKTFGFSNAKDTAKIRQVGEIWEETDINGNTIWWEQKQGYRVKYGVHPEIAQALKEAQEFVQSFPNCQKETCTCKQPTRIDEKFRRMVGMCEDCLIGYETSLKIKGQFNEYALEKMKRNAESFFEQADKEFEVLKREVDNINFAGDENDVNPIEKWSYQDPEAYKKHLDEKYNEFKTKTMEKFK